MVLTQPAYILICDLFGILRFHTTMVLTQLFS